MARLELRVRVDGAGRLEVVDPGFDCLELLRAVDPGFEVQVDELPCGPSPRFLSARRTGVGVALASLAVMTEEALWVLHLAVTGPSDAPARPANGEASLLDLKHELSLRLLSPCRLCGHRCGVDRLAGEHGRCGLGDEARVAEHFVHIAEEPSINPSQVTSLAGCGLKCRFCQQWRIRDGEFGEPLDAALWGALKHQGARTISFAGGNPDESLPFVLNLLRTAPASWDLPVVWNTHAYSSPEVLALLDGVVDVFLPDLKFLSSACAGRLTGAERYPSVARQAVTTMVSQGVAVIVRMLVLPGHVECCHLPALEFLARLPREEFTVSVRGQYHPDAELVEVEGPMGTRADGGEVARVRERARRLRLLVG